VISLTPPSSIKVVFVLIAFAKYKALPWGNYSTTCLDPSDAHRLWTYQEYANSDKDGEWSTAWASFQLGK
jgi:hypothetical protein